MVILSAAILMIVLVQIVRLYLLNKKEQKILSQLTNRHKELNYLNLLTSAALSDKSTLEQILPKYLNVLKEQLGWTFHSIFRLDEERQLLTIRFTGYLPDWYMEELSTKVFIRVGDASVGRAVSTKQPAIINVANQDPRFKDVLSLTGRTGYKSLSCYPLAGRIKTYGGFCTYSEFENIFTLSDISFFTTVSNIFAAIIENKLLESYLKKIA